ncbi:MAG: aminotransferase class I/II-fold pyridoxal phosphate-dependent enzyme [Pyrinomonadaceae bacterium]
MKAMQQNENFQLPRRLQGVQPTLIRQIFERALPDSINFGLGEPDLPTPQFIREEAARVTLKNKTVTRITPEFLPLRELIAASYPHLNLQPNQVCVTVGSQEAMTAAFLAIVDEGDEVLIPNPAFPAYENCVKICRRRSGFLSSSGGQRFRVSTSKNSNRKSPPKTKAAVVISPSNPTGKIFTENDLRQIAEVLKDTGIYLISDEIYTDLYFTDEKPRSASEFYDRTIIVDGFIKIFEYDRLARRLAGKLANRCRQSRADVARIFDRLHFDDFAESVACSAGLPEAESAKAEAREIYKRRGEFLIDILQKELGLRGTHPEGAFYTMLDVRSLGDDLAVAEKFLQNRVITVPESRSATEAKGFLRMSFCNSEERMAEGVRRMKEALKLSGKK